ncbi:MAG: hypothetical protein V4663_13635 [Bacteroidota bacterium]
MKRILLSLFCLSFSLALFAQKTLPEIKAGTNMIASVYVQGTAYPLTFSVKSIKAPTTLAWSVEGYGDGEFVMSEKALESGTSLFLTQPGLGATKLSDSETYGLISKAAYKLLVDTKGFTYSGIKFKAKTTGLTPMKIGDKEIDVTQIASEDGKIELWILNNPNFPFILQTMGMPIDLVVSEIK